MEIIIYTVNSAFTIYYWLILIYFISSWIPSMRESEFIQKISVVVEPYLSIFRKFIPPIGMIDISSIVAIIVYGFIQQYALIGLYSLLTLIF